MRVWAVSVPEYTVDREPDHDGIGARVDAVIREHCLGHKIVARGLSADDHPDLDINDLIAVIRATGMDRYDPDRVGDRYVNVEGRRIDFFGIGRTVTPRMRLFSQLTWGFYHGSIEVHGRPTRLDLLTIYDAQQVRSVLHRYEGRTDRKRDGYRFVDPQSAADAVLGIVRIGR